MKHIQSPLDSEDIKNLKAGDKVLLSGTIYSARDAAHKKMIDTLANGGGLPFDLKGQTIYYVGPSPAKEGAVIGSAGPTTSGRMDAFTPTLLELGLSAMIGKGKRSQTVKDSIKDHGVIYFSAIGGAAALIADAITTSEIIAYEELGTEAIRKLTVKNFPLVVAVDSNSDDYYEIGRQAFLEKETR